MDMSKNKISEDTQQEKLHFLQVLIDAIPTPIFYKDTRAIYIGCNSAFLRYLGKSKEEIIGKSVFDISPSELAATYHKADAELLEHGGDQVYEASAMYADGTLHNVIFNKALFYNTDGKVGGLIGTIFDITERKQAEQERDRLISSLQNALAEIKMLQGILPICSSCRKIRDDEGSWHKLETYISEHSDAEFTHGLCIECAQKLYPSYYKKDAT